ncbi:MAG: hypothetical protein WAK18_09290 [Nocardioidaceae bacterium]
MSTFLNQARARSLRPGLTLPRPRLTIVPKVAARAPRIPFAVLVISVLAGGLVGLLLLNTALQRGAYEVTALQDTSDGLTLRQQNLETEVASLQSPQRISERAVRLGMVANDSPAFLSLETGQVIGVPKVGTRAHRPTIGALPARTAGRDTKVASDFAGEGLSGSTGAVKVARQAPDKPAAGKPGGTNPADTRGASAAHGGPQVTNNTSNTN